MESGEVAALLARRVARCEALFCMESGEAVTLFGAESDKMRALFYHPVGAVSDKVRTLGGHFSELKFTCFFFLVQKMD